MGTVHVTRRTHLTAGQRLMQLGRLAACWCVVSAGSVAAQPSEAPSTVTLHYLQRPPYMMVSGDGLTGLTGGPSYQAFKTAKVPVRIEETPFARQLHYLEINSGMDCMIGMFRKPEREKFAKYSKPVYQDRPQELLTTVSSATRLRGHAGITEVLQDKRLRLLVKLGYSYGATLDALIEKHQPTRQSTTDENLAMIRQIRMGMADYMFMAPEEAATAIQAAGYSSSEFALIRFRNMPAGEHRHLLCSKNVPDSVMERLNAAIAFRK